MNALTALWHHRSSIGLVGNHIDIQSGRWTAHDAGIGAGVDSYFEYLAKGALFLQKPELMNMFNQYRKVSFITANAIVTLKNKTFSLAR